LVLRTKRMGNGPENGEETGGTEISTDGKVKWGRVPTNQLGPSHLKNKVQREFFRE